jgi:hypothetical protein
MFGPPPKRVLIFRARQSSHRPCQRELRGGSRWCGNLKASLARSLQQAERWRDAAVGAEESLRRGPTKERAEQARKSAREKVSARKKVLAFGVAIRERAILDRRCARRRRKSAVGQKKACGADARREELVAIIGAH